MFISDIGWSSSLPPLGRRVYILKPELKYHPVEIKSNRHIHNQEVMRDPVGILSKSESKRENDYREPEIPSSKRAQLHFATVKVKGRKLRPREKFKGSQLKITLSDNVEDVSVKKSLEKSFTAIHNYEVQ